MMPFSTSQRKLRLTDDRSVVASMEKARILVSLTNDNNDYQQEQAKDAEQAARRLDLTLRLANAKDDAVLQSQQLAEAIVAPSESRPHAIVVEPVGTGMPQLARAAAAAGIGWVILNREAAYISEMKQQHRSLMFAITSDHEKIGQLQGQQVAALLPSGGTVLLIEGPPLNDAAQKRTAGFNKSRPRQLQVRTLRAQWTEDSARRAVQTWLGLPTSRRLQVDLVAAQDDSMAMGARRAFESLPEAAEQTRRLAVPFLGIDGMPRTGQKWVRQGLLAATVVVPTNTGLALEMLAKAFRGGEAPPERTMTLPTSYPPLEQLSSRSTRK